MGRVRWSLFAFAATGLGSYSKIHLQRSSQPRRLHALHDYCKGLRLISSVFLYLLLLYSFSSLYFISIIIYLTQILPPLQPLFQPQTAKKYSILVNHFICLLFFPPLIMMWLPQILPSEFTWSNLSNNCRLMQLFAKSLALSLKSFIFIEQVMSSSKNRILML